MGFGLGFFSRRGRGDGANGDDDKSAPRVESTMAAPGSNDNTKGGVSSAAQDMFTPDLERQRQMQDDGAETRSGPPMGSSTAGLPDDNADLVTTAEDRDLKRGLHERHLSMLGIAGAIGTGLFLGLG